MATPKVRARISFYIPLLAVAGVVAMLPALAGDATPARSASDAATAKLDVAVDQMVDVELLSGAKYEQATLLRVVDDNVGEPKSVRVRLETGQSRTVRLSAVRTIHHAGHELYRADEEAPNKPKTKKQQRVEEEAKRKAEEHQKWVGRLAARGIEPWGPISQEEHEQAIGDHKKQYEEVSKVIPGMYMVETDQYLFFSNMPRNQAGMYIAYLDEMYEWMCRAYGLDDGATVWRGKAAIYVFNTKAEFARFEQQFMNTPSSTVGFAQGLCHSNHRRVITISCHLGTDPAYFAAVLVHETSHGFVACYKTPVRLPSWVNEGMAENIAMLMVPKDKGVRGKIDKFVSTLRSNPNPRLGKDFFVVGQNIQPHYYGAASSMVWFMMETDQEKFVQFVDLLKEGMPWEEALQASYKATKEELVAAYGRWIQVQNLQL